MLITPTLLDRWFSQDRVARSRPSYRSHLEKVLEVEEIDLVRDVFTKHLCDRTVSWSASITYFIIVPVKQ